LFGAGKSAQALNAKCGTTALDGSAAGVCLSDSSQIRSSIGASLLWNSPLGPLRLDLAKALTYQKDPLTGQSIDKLKPFSFGATTKF
jgi:outer membrane protein insertion porin family